MPSSLEHLFEKNRTWSNRMTEHEPEFFRKLVSQQAPEYLWIGCSDSRVPANEIVGLLPGEMFVHRNVANLVVHTDLNCLSVLQYAVDVLKVAHVIVCGHYGCGGVRAAFSQNRLGLIDNWLRHVQDVRDRHHDLLEAGSVSERTVNRLCELNVIEQVRNVCQTSIIEEAWERGQPLEIHGWIYGLGDGRLRDLGVTIQSRDRVAANYQAAVDALSLSAEARP